jgi:hypothetical protein
MLLNKIQFDGYLIFTRFCELLNICGSVYVQDDFIIQKLVLEMLITPYLRVLEPFWRKADILMLKLRCTNVTLHRKIGPSPRRRGGHTSKTRIYLGEKKSRSSISTEHAARSYCAVEAQQHFNCPTAHTVHTEKTYRVPWWEVDCVN